MQRAWSHTNQRRRDLKNRRRRQRRPLAASSPNRQGSTLMIVIVLLGLLSVLGVVFYTFANQERSNAEYYADGAKVVEAPGLTADELMDHALEQLIVGPRPSYKNSVLWGKRHSLIANMMGLQDQKLTDLTAFNGQGVNLSQSGAAPFVDQNYDGMADSGQLFDAQGNVVRTGNNGSNVQDLLGFNDSPAANDLFERQTHKLPQPDVGYTYPDQNNTFLAYIAHVRDRSGGGLRQVVIPSFHRPQLYRDGSNIPIPLWEDLNYNGSIDAGEDRNGNSTLDTGSTAANRQFRAHPGHVYVPRGQRSGTPVSRYIFNAGEAASLLGDEKRVFPFLPMYDGYDPTANMGSVTLTSRPATWIGHQGVWSGPHPTDTNRNDEYQFDVDNDGDGIREGVWLDLDFPVQEAADGTYYVPLFSFTVYDLDGLINLNAHGNVQNLLFALDSMGARAVAFNNVSNQFGYNTNTGAVEFISQSNHGMHAAEVNPAWALTGRAGIDSSTPMATVFDDYQRFYGNLPLDATSLSAQEQFRRSSYQETANMDLAFLKFGRPEVTGSNIDDLYPGLYGEEHLIARYFSSGSNNPVQFPHPGQSLSDDNGDINENMEFQPQSISGTPTVWLDVDQPRDTTGLGSIISGNNPRALNRVNPGNPTSRVRWLRYTGYASNGAVAWGQPSLQSGGLMQTSESYGLFDDPSEVALYAEDRRDVDDPFQPDDAAFLALDNDDINNLGITSRLEDLASFNFSSNINTNSRGEAIRKRFTTVSNDRKSYALPTAGGAGRTWEWNDDQGFSAQTAVDKVRFPPAFGAAGSVVARYSAQDPFRSPVRYLLQATQDDLQVKQYQQRLAVNQVLVFDWQSPNSTELVYRDLTLHPLMNAGGDSAPIPTTVPQYRGSYPWPSAADQEFWARRDRQWLARDIYVLLYLLGGGLDNTSALDHTGSAIGSNGYLKSNAANELYTDEQLEQMARFAVNLVDAQDKDRVITRFEYDKDLSNGWNLDDNPYTVDSSSDRAEVWGVERQELAFSEGLVFRTAAESMVNRSQTAHDDQEERMFLCVEMRNLAPYDIRFDDNIAWQLVVRQYEPGDPMYNAALERQLTLKAGSGTVRAGGFYTLFSTDRDEPSTNPSAFQVDPDGSSGLQWIVPRDSAFAAPASATGQHIDLVAEASAPTPPFDLRDGSGASLTGTAGALLTDGAPAMGGGAGNFVLDETRATHIILRRRAHPTRTRPSSGNTAQEDDNPWVEVDRFITDTNMPVFDYPDSGNDATTQLAGLRSDERTEPLSRTTSKAPSSNRANTFGSGVGAENTSSPTPLALYQTHFDREFTSLGELLNLPLVGPPPSNGSSTRTDGLTTYFAAMNEPPYSTMSTQGQYGLPGTGTYFDNFAKTAAGMFMVPDYPDAIDSNPALDNRWHRVLELLEIPTRQHRNLGLASSFEIQRVPGKVNLNMLRHPEVLAALIDDERILDFSATNPNMTLPRMVNQTDTAIDWFEQLQNSRDPQDSYWMSQGQDLRLPGLPNDAAATAPAYPFRSLSDVVDNGSGQNTVQHTLLRKMPVDIVNGQPTQRQLFEIGNHGEHTNPLAINPTLRHQVLSKIWNNTTTRSNCFVVFISSKLFRAAVDSTTGAVRIGGPVKEYNAPDVLRPELPEYRGVFIVDRSLVEKGVSTGGAGFTNFRPFVTYRRILQEE